MIRPPYLKQDDCVAIVAPAGNVSEEQICNAVVLLQKWGLRVLVGPHAAGNYIGFAGSDAERCADLQAAINNPEVKAIVCARGGYGCSRIVDTIDFAPLLQKPKWLVGFSDITVLHARLQHIGLQSIHGPMTKSLQPDISDTESAERLRQALFGKLKTYIVPAHPLNKQGTAQGILTGGNLSLLTALAATPDDLQANRTILFLEEIGESLYHVDRMMGNLKRSGKLNKLAGIIVGYFSEMSAVNYFQQSTAYDILTAYANPLNIPVCYGFPAGHEEPNYALYFGREIQLAVEADSCRISFNSN